MRHTLQYTHTFCYSFLVSYIMVNQLYAFCVYSFINVQKQKCFIHGEKDAQLKLFTICVCTWRVCESAFPSCTVYTGSCVCVYVTVLLFYWATWKLNSVQMIYLHSSALFLLLLLSPRGCLYCRRRHRLLPTHQHCMLL